MPDQQLLLTQSLSACPVLVCTPWSHPGEADEWSVLQVTSFFKTQGSCRGWNSSWFWLIALQDMVQCLVSLKDKPSTDFPLLWGILGWEELPGGG